MDTNNGMNEPDCIDQSLQAGSSNKGTALVAGVTGGIATGKSTICAMFRELGAQVISADDVAHALMTPRAEVWSRIIAEFGEGILSPDSTIDRKALGTVVFADAAKRSRLEQIIHPHVLRYLADKAAAFRACGHGILILEIPLLIETSSMHVVDKVIVVTAEQNTQMTRLQDRTGLSADEAMLRVGSQMPADERETYADWVVNTEQSITSTKKVIRRIWLALQNILAHTK